MSSTSADQKQALDTQAVNNFREYLQIPSVHPDINYDECVRFLEKQAKSLELEFKVVNVAPRKPIVILSWWGKQKSLPSILVNSHMDVVAVYEDKWSQKPFGGDIVDGKIYGRGAQDMKCVGIWYLETIRRLKLKKISLKRSVHVTFVPDEEIGGIEGMKKFVETKDFQDLNVGLGLDEGITSPTDTFYLFYDERVAWQMKFTCPGISMHGALLEPDTAGDKVANILKNVYEFRTKELEKLKNTGCELGKVTSINLNIINGGIQTNIVPGEIKMIIDCRISPKEDIDQFQKMINKWCLEAGSGVQLEFIQKGTRMQSTKLDSTNVYWVAFKKATDALNMKIEPVICPGRTDGAYLRSKGIPVFGFSPINNNPLLIHQNDEFLHVDTFIKGIDIYCKIFEALGNL